jgi:putative transposase
VGTLLATSKGHSWKHRDGQANEHNAWIPRDHWLTDKELQAIIAFHDLFPLEGYRRLTFMMLDRDVVACSPASVYRVLKEGSHWDERRPAAAPPGQGHQERHRLGTALEGP